MTEAPQNPEEKSEENVQGEYRRWEANERPTNQKRHASEFESPIRDYEFRRAKATGMDMFDL